MSVFAEKFRGEEIRQIAATSDRFLIRGDVENAPTLRLSSRSFTQAIAALTVIILVMYALGQFVRVATGHDNALGFIPLFDLNGEGNVPTWASSILFFLCSAVLFIISSLKFKKSGSFKNHWIGLAVIFIFLSIDEVAQIHEKSAIIIDSLFSSIPIIQIGSALPLGLLVLGVAVSYFRFLRSLPRKTAILFIVSGLIYILGALIVDYFAGEYFHGIGDRKLALLLLHTAEEIFEIAGLTLFLACLLNYCSLNFPEVKISLSQAERL